MPQSIDDIQQEIIDEFALLEGNREETLFYLMDLGERLPPLDEAKKTEDNIVKGCQSKVWLVPHQDEDRLSFEADSNTEITKGLLSLLVRVFNGQQADNILSTDLYFIDKIGMNRFIGTQRSNGFAAMIKQIKLFALVSAKQQQS